MGRCRARRRSSGPRCAASRRRSTTPGSPLGRRRGRRQGDDEERGEQDGRGGRDGSATCGHGGHLSDEVDVRPVSKRRSRAATIRIPANLHGPIGWHEMTMDAARRAGSRLVGSPAAAGGRRKEAMTDLLLHEREQAAVRAIIASEPGARQRRCPASARSRTSPGSSTATPSGIALVDAHAGTPSSEVALRAAARRRSPEPARCRAAPATARQDGSRCSRGGAQRARRTSSSCGWSAARGTSPSATGPCWRWSHPRSSGCCASSRSPGAARAR